MSVSNQIVSQALNLALRECDRLEQGVTKAVQDFKALKAGEVTIDQLVVTDAGWEFMPAIPAVEEPPFRAESNGAKAKAEEPLGATA